MRGPAKVGDIITLRDLQTMIQLLPGDASVANGMDLLVTRVTHVREANGVCEWFIYGTDSALNVVVTRVDGNDYYRVMFEVAGLPEGDRADWIESGNHWLFLEPSSDEYVDRDLVYTEEILNQDICYKQKRPSLFGECDGVFAVIHEWLAVPGANSSPENPEIIVVEVGNVNDPRGGFITFLQGASIAEGDIEFMSV